jgi:hypothetical protein
MDAFITMLKETRGLKPRTLHIYRTKLGALAKEITDKEFVNSDFLVDKYEKVKKFLKKQTNSTMANYIKSILVALYPVKPEGGVPVSKDPTDRETAYHNYVKLLHDTKVVYETSIEDGKKSEKDEKNWITWNEVLEIADKYKKLVKSKKITGKSKDLSPSDLLLLKKYLIISLYTQIAPQRTSTFVGLKYIKPPQYDKLTSTDKQKYSYLLEGANPFFSIGGDTLKNKTDKANILLVNDKLKSVINLWRKHNRTEYLIPNNAITKEIKAMDYKEFGKLFVDIFEPYVDGKIITPSLLRKSHISSNKDYKDLEDAQSKVEQTAKVMNHSKNVAMKVYKKKST